MAGGTMNSGKARHEEPAVMVRGDIAIIGMACLFPGAPDLETYWQNIVSKVDAITDPPSEAWDVDVLYDPSSTANDRVYCKRGGFLGPIAYFDPLEHGIMPLAVQGGEPDQWLALQVACAALADSGYRDQIPERYRTAVILGKGNYLNRGNFNILQHGMVIDQTMQILKTLQPEYTEADLQVIRQKLKECLPPFNADTVPGLIPNSTAGRIANRLDLMGPSYTIDAACASSLIAVDMAARDLLTHQCDLALVGGVHVVTSVPVLMVFCQLGALSRQQQIRPFDKDADGTIPGEGIGMVVLKRREDAERDGNRIYAVIKGVGVSSDGRGLSVTAPRLEGEVLALQLAYKKASLSPRTIGLIEAHGTGTPVGDATEVEALTRIFGPRDSAFSWCALGSVKSMIGHLMPAAGIAGLIKAALALYYKVLPPTLNIDEPNPKLKLEKTPFYINTEPRPWIHGAHNTPRRAGVNAFGFGGINAHVILEEFHVADNTVFQSRQRQLDTEVCILTAGSRLGLIRRLQQLQQFLKAGPHVHLKDLAYTLNVPIGGGSYRVAIVASTIEDLQQKLDRTLERLSDVGCRQIKEVQGIYFFEQPLATSGQLAFLFPGEGSQYANMLADLCLHFPVVRETFDEIDRVFAAHASKHVPSDFIFPRPTFSKAERRAAEEQLWQMERAVEAVLTANRALFTLLNRLGIHPDAVVGHSTGEYSAMFASGMINLTDESLIRQFVTELNQVYQQVTAEGGIPRAALVAVGADFETVSALIEQIDSELYIAMDNCPHQTVIVGKESAVEQALEQLHRRGLISERLPFNRPYHTPLFEGFAARLRAFFARWLISPPRIQTYSCTTMSLFSTDLAQIQKSAVEHWIRPVGFRKTIEEMHADGVRIFVEVGPRGNLSSFVNDILRGRPHLAVPVNVMHHSGVTQLHHLVGMLAAQNIPMQLDYLYTGRSCRKLALDRPDDPEGLGRKSIGPMKLATGWPLMRLTEEAAARLRSRIQTISAASSAPNVRTQAKTTTNAVHTAAATGPEVVPGADQSDNSLLQSEQRPTSADRVMLAHLKIMEQIVAAQEEVMRVFLTGQATAPAPSGSVRLSSGKVEASNAEFPSQGSSPNSVETYEALASPVPAMEEVAQPTSSPQPSLLPKSDEVGRLAPKPTGLLNAKALADVLLHLVSERTGYPFEMLDLNLDLEAELGIDSIKRVEILGSFQRQTALLQAEDMEVLARCKRFQEVIDFLMARREEPKGSIPASPAYTARGTSASASRVIPPMPFIGTVISLIPGEELVVLYEINLDEDLFLRDHTLGRQVSMTDPGLEGLHVMPLTMSMEMLAEAAAVLMPGQHLLGMRNVRIYRWITLEGDRLTLKLFARRNPSASGREIYVQILEADAIGGSQGRAAAPILEGTMIFGEVYPEPPLAGEFTLRGERPSRWAPELLYEDVMFHGSAFRGVVSMDSWGEDGAKATLEVLPSSGLLRSNPNPCFITDPVLLDQPGQVVGFWAAEHLDTGYLVFPFRLEALHLYGSNPSAAERLNCRARIHLVGERQVRSDLDIVGPDSLVWARFVGWEDRRFDLPRAFFRFMLSPREVVLSEPWPILTASLPDSEALQACRLNLDAFPEGFFTAHNGIWQRVLAHLVLSRHERELWSSLRTPEPRRLEWLLGRVIAKDAVRLYLRQHYGIVLCPADIEILSDGNGRPLTRGSWTNQVPCMPTLSLSHAAGTAVAVVGGRDTAAGIGVDIERMRRMNEDVGGVAFTPQEQELLSSMRDMEKEGWSLRLWCAKEAVAKALGYGMIDGPRALVVQGLEAHTGMVQVGLAGELAHQICMAEGLILTAFTIREGDLIAAISLFNSEGRGKGYEEKP